MPKRPNISSLIVAGTQSIFYEDDASIDFDLGITTTSIFERKFRRNCNARRERAGGGGLIISFVRSLFLSAARERGHCSSVLEFNSHTIDTGSMKEFWFDNLNLPSGFRLHHCFLRTYDTVRAESCHRWILSTATGAKCGNGTSWPRLHCQIKRSSYNKDWCLNAFFSKQKRRRKRKTNESSHHKTNRWVDRWD